MSVSPAMYPTNVHEAVEDAEASAKAGSIVEERADTNAPYQIGSHNLVADLLQQQIALLRQISERQAVADDIRTLLREMNDRQAAADPSRKSIAPVTAQSSSAWNPLLNSTLSRIGLIIDRWRGSVDVLLVFVGLFSAIVTSFFVDSLTRLSPDQGARTNELLVNLTEITIQLSGTRASQLQITSPVPFVPDASDVRVNAYWSLALIISISAAALAVAGRAFLATLTKSTGKPHEKLTDVSRRWKQAEVLLGPALETLPVILTIPVLLFLVGLLENVFSAALLPHHVAQPIIICASISAATIFSVGATLFYALVHTYRHPETSPFRTTLSQVLRTFVEHILTPLRSVQALIHWIVSHCRPSVTSRGSDPEAQPSEEGRPFCIRVARHLEPFFHPVQTSSHWVATHIPLSNRIPQPESQDEPQLTEIDDRINQYLPVVDYAYHTTLQATHDDDALDQAAAALASICGNSKTRELVLLKQRQAGQSPVILSGLEMQSFVHLLSPEASYRCNLTAAECISVLNGTEWPGITLWNPLCTLSNRFDLLFALVDAARRESSLLSGHNVWHSVFFRSFAVLVRSERRHSRLWSSKHLTRTLQILTSDYVSHTVADTVRTEEERQIGILTIKLTFSCIFDAVWRASLRDVNRSQTEYLRVIKLLAESQPPWEFSEINRTPSELEATVCLCLWDRTHDKILVNRDVPQPDVSFVRAVVQWIWSMKAPTTEDIVTIISMPVFLRSTEPRQWLIAVLEELICMMESRRQNWQQFDTRVLVTLVRFHHLTKKLHSESTHNDSPSLGEIIGHIGLHMANTRPDRFSIDLVRSLASRYAVSALIEMLFFLCQTRAIEDIPLVDIDVALVRILGPREQSTISNLNVEVCLAFSDGTSMLTKEQPSEASLKTFIAALIRWLWSDDLTSAVEVSQHVATFNHIARYQLAFSLDNVVMALIRLEHSRTHTLDQAFVLLSTEITDIHRSTLALDLLDFIVTCTRPDLSSTSSHDNRGPFSREQANILCRTYQWLDRVEYYWGDREERVHVLVSVRELWMDLYGSEGSGPDGEVIVPHIFSDDTIQNIRETTS